MIDTFLSLFFLHFVEKKLDFTADWPSIDVHLRKVCLEGLVCVRKG